MFFIVNKTRKTITLGDLGISLGPRQAIDLDKTNIPRSKSDISQSLKNAKRNGDIEIRINDRPNSKVIPNTKIKTPSDELGDMKKEIIGEMKDVMKEFLQAQRGGVSKEDLQELIKAMPKSSETVVYRQEGEKTRADEEVKMDEGLLVEINARTVDNIVEGTDIKSMKYKEETQENTILNNIDELEGLL